MVSVQALLPRKRTSSVLDSGDGLETETNMAAPGAASSVVALGEETGLEAVHKVLDKEELMLTILAHLDLEDLCRVALVRRSWRMLTDSPEFWRTISLRGRTLQVAKVVRLLRRHSCVQRLDARGVRFSPADLADVLPGLTELRSLELDKPGYEDRELAAIGDHLPALTRLVLAGGAVGSPGHMFHHHAHAAGAAAEWPTLRHPGLECVTLECGRAPRLRLALPRLASLELRDFNCGSLQLAEGGALESLTLADCGKMSDSALRFLLCLEGEASQPRLPRLANLLLSGVVHVSDETLRSCGQRHTGLTRLALTCCPALTGEALARGGGFASLQELILEACDSLCGSKLSDSLHDMHALQTLTIVGCTQLNTLSLRSHSLRRISLRGTRALTELELRCPAVEEVDIAPLAQGLAAAAGLRRIVLASHAATRLAWAGFPALREVVLSCPSLEELDLSECGQLRDGVFESLGPGPGGWVGGPDAPPACPRLRLLKLAECDGLRAARLASPSLERLVMGQCRGVVSVELDCPRLAGLALEECTSLEDARLRLAAMTSMSLGTCPRLSSISLDSPAMASLDLRGCNELSHLALACPSLRRVDATFCSGLGDAALAVLAGCPALEELVLAVCSSVSGGGLAALAAARRLARLDLSYNAELEDPRPLAAACPGLTSLALSSDYRLNPQLLLELFPPPPAPRALPALRELDASYCCLPPEALAALALRGGAQLHTLLINGCGEGARDALWPLLHSGPLRPGPAADALLAPLRGGGGALAPSAPQLPCTSALRCLSMVGSKQLRHFRLGLAPAAEAAAAGLLPAEGDEDAVMGVELGGARHVALATPLAGLTELRLSISAVHSLTLGLPVLHDLQLNKCEELAHLALASPSLARLSLQACRLPPKVLVGVAAGLPALEVLDLQYAPPELSAPAVEAALRAACPSLREVLFTKAPPSPR